MGRRRGRMLISVWGVRWVMGVIDWRESFFYFLARFGQCILLFFFLRFGDQARGLVSTWVRIQIVSSESGLGDVCAV